MGNSKQIKKLKKEIKKKANKKTSDNSGTKAGLRLRSRGMLANGKRTRNTKKAKGNLKKKELNVLHKAATRRGKDDNFKFSKRALHKITFIKPNKTMIPNIYKDAKRTLRKIGKTLKRRSI